jgi:hypothetical protein
MVCRKTRQEHIVGGNVTGRSERVDDEPRKRQKTEKALGTQQKLYDLLMRWFMGP